MREFASEGKHWSPCASTLVTGETEAVLADTGIGKPQEAISNDRMLDNISM
jgi:hypothetical protein